jgi:DNA-binding CsgD family transcriptional regulator
MSVTVEFGGLIGIVYEAAAAVEAWPSALTAIADALNADTVSLTIIDKSGAVSLIHVAPRTDPSWRQRFIERWSGTNLVREQGLKRPVGHAYQFEDLLPRSEFERTAFYNEFFLPQRIEVGLFANITNAPMEVCGIGFNRSRRKGPFDRNEQQLLNSLAPHLQRAVSLNLRVLRCDTARRDLSSIVNYSEEGAFLVDKQARILFANNAGEAMLRDGTGLRASNGRLTTSVPTKTEALRAMVSGGAGSRSMLATPRRDGTNLVIQVLPASGISGKGTTDASIVFVKEPKERPLPSREQIQALFDLTPAQAALAREILLGDGAQAAAARLGISHATARSHLLQVFDRTGTSRQAELVRLILQRSLPERRP